MTGAEKSGNSQKSRQLVQELSNRIAIEDFSQEDAGMAARIRATLEASGRSIGPMDMLIAGQALCRGYAVATNNVREFSRIPGLICEDWLIA